MCDNSIEQHRTSYNFYLTDNVMGQHRQLLRTLTRLRHAEISQTQHRLHHKHTPYQTTLHTASSMHIIIYYLMPYYDHLHLKESLRKSLMARLNSPGAVFRLRRTTTTGRPVMAERRCELRAPYMCPILRYISPTGGVCPLVTGSPSITAGSISRGPDGPSSTTRDT